MAPTIAKEQNAAAAQPIAIVKPSEESLSAVPFDAAVSSFEGSIGTFERDEAVVVSVAVAVVVSVVVETILDNVVEDCRAADELEGIVVLVRVVCSSDGVSEGMGGVVVIDVDTIVADDVVSPAVVKNRVVVDIVVDVDGCVGATVVVVASVTEFSLVRPQHRTLSPPAL